MVSNALQFTVKRRKEPSTVLVPEKLIPFLRKRVKKHKGKMDQYFVSLLRNANQVGIQKLPGAQKLKTRYQKQGQRPIRVYFRVDNFVWHDAKQIARSRGYSICYLFVLLLIKDKRSFELLKQDIQDSRSDRIFIEIFRPVARKINRQIFYNLNREKPG